MVNESGWVRWRRIGTMSFQSYDQLDLRDFPWGDSLIKTYFTAMTQWNLRDDVGIRLWPEQSTADELQYAQFSISIDEVRNLDPDEWGREWEEESQPLYVVLELRVTIAPYYYITNVMFPVSVMVMIQLLGVWLPLNSGERVAYSATAMLTVFAIMLFTAELRPATAYITWLDWFQICGVALCFLPLAEAIAMIWLKH